MRKNNLHVYTDLQVLEHFHTYDKACNLEVRKLCSFPIQFEFKCNVAKTMNSPMERCIKFVLVKLEEHKCTEFMVYI